MARECGGTAAWAGTQVAAARADPEARIALLECCYRGPFGKTAAFVVRTVQRAVPAKRRSARGEPDRIASAS